MSENVINIFRNAAFDPEALRVLGEAYDVARRNTPNTVSEEVVARAILEAARTGERSTEQLAEVAIQIAYAKGCESDVRPAN